ncbi:HAMP domain-containing sensor histidine kinase [Rhodoferax antarcticus]|uniref:HAMP domain-containing sensor histidine kinase n=1 Tax=Rhodoferax antarcticus TaxID=81479 RepID=UPI00094F7324|nr:ATP-binding protein [Rhodoferax antarcticus]APW45485.1 two-component sensor histidine kinase [Rhodoferax antarcticus]MCW2312644.1 signal transduction histidine kinase [Rhodoferax antarcticus]
MFQKLYVRIWLAVVLALAVLILLVGWIWRLAAEPPPREVVVIDEAGQIVGRGQPHRQMDHLPSRELREQRRASRQARHQAEQAAADPDAANTAPANASSAGGADSEGAAPESTAVGVAARPGGSEFLVRMQDGKTVRLRLTRPPPSIWSRPPFGFAWMLVWVGLAVALATYPIVRTLTRRLERLQRGVQQWGAGDLSARMPETGSDEVAFLAKRFNHAAERVESLVKSHEVLLASQKSLLANASHELRSPLTRIRMGLELMGPGVSPTSRAEIARNIHELDELIEEILLASRLEASETDMGTIESVDLVGLAAEECARVDAELLLPADPSAPDSGQFVHELAVQGVAKLLRRAVRNLLENARRHAAGEVSLRLSLVAQHAEIRVCDRGPGVPPELMERIFEPFYRLPGATERAGGVGLGLALVKSIAQRHGGRAFCENRPEGGACFIIELPLP